ncbi:MAG: DUF4261 domain-containing protein [Lachnospiraceae bacterium]|nr:DUF4261 domain-containing protein [Lachnospiraceae bacterium]
MLFGKKKEDKKKTEKQFAEEEQSSEDAIIRPGAPFVMQFLMKGKCSWPDESKIQEVLTKYLGEVEAIGDRTTMVSFAAKEYMGEFADAKKVPVMISFTECDELETEKFNDFERQQWWDYEDKGEHILAECKYKVMATDMMGGALPPQVRANMLMNYLEALLELYPQCQAVHFINSKKLVPADMIRNSQVEGLDRYIKFAVNARFFNISGTNDHVVDTLGLSVLYLEDQQYHFHDMDPNWVVNHALNMASYRLGSDAEFKPGDTIDGIVDGRIVQNVQWQCHYEESLIAPHRNVLDVCMNEYAAGNRDYR